MHLLKVHISQLCILRCCIYVLSIKYAKGTFNPNASEGSTYVQIKVCQLTNIVQHIYRTIYKLLPNTIVDFTRLRLLQSCLLPK